MFISTPNKDDEQGSKEGKWGFCEKQGQRPEQEDALVFHMPEHNPYLNLTPQEIGDCLKKSLSQLDKRAPKNPNEPNKPVGSTVSTTIWTGTHLITATLGDAVAFAIAYGNGNEVLGVTGLNSVIHSPYAKEEQERTYALDNSVTCRAGGMKKTVTLDGYNEDTQTIAVTRAIGDNVPFWQNDDGESIISSEAAIDIAELKKICRNAQKYQIITTCDGFTEPAKPKFYSHQAIKEEQVFYLLEKLHETYKENRDIDEKQLALKLAEKAIKDGSTDNVSVAVITLDPSKAFLVGVFDGHGGHEVSHYLAHHFCPTFYATCFIKAVEKELNGASISPQVLTVINKYLEDILKLVHSPEELEVKNRELKTTIKTLFNELDPLTWPFLSRFKSLLDVLIALFLGCLGVQTFKAREKEISKVRSGIEKLHEIVEQHHQRDSEEEVQVLDEGSRPKKSI